MLCKEATTTLMAFVNIQEVDASPTGGKQTQNPGPPSENVGICGIVVYHDNQVSILQVDACHVIFLV